MIIRVGGLWPGSEEWWDWGFGEKPIGICVDVGRGEEIIFTS